VSEKRLGGELVKLGSLLPNIKPPKPKQPSKIELRVIEAAATMDPQSIVYQHTVFCQAALPYRDPGNNVMRWERKNGNVSLLVTAKEVCNPVTGEWKPLGIPFGTKPRLILGDINTQAILMQSPEIDIEQTLSRYVKRLGGHNCGQDIKAVKEAISRLCSAMIQIALPHEGRMLQRDTQLTSSFDVWFTKDDRQRVFWPSRARLSSEYFELLLAHAVPLDEERYCSLSHSAMAMDIYAWLAQRLHRIHKRSSTLVSWKQLQLQFGWHYTRIRKFREVFKVALDQALVAYRDARVTADWRGLVLANSPPPVRKTQMVV
jgi:hypothetical protein